MKNVAEAASCEKAQVACVHSPSDCNSAGSQLLPRFEPDYKSGAVGFLVKNRATLPPKMFAAAII